MATKKTIAVIGAADEREVAFAISLLKGAYRLLLIAEDDEKLIQLQEEIKPINETAEEEVIKCAREACWEADIIIPLNPYPINKELVQNIKEVSVGKVVVNFVSSIESFDANKEKIQELLPYSKIVTVEDTIVFSGKEDQTEKLKATIISEDDEALEIVSELLKTINLNPIITNSGNKIRTL